MIRLFLFLWPALVWADISKFKPWTESPRELREALKVSGVLEKSSQSDDTWQLSLVLETLGPFKIYDESLKFSLIGESQDLKVKNITKPSSISFLDPITKTVKSGYRGQSEFDLYIAGGPDLRRLQIGIQLQVCSDKICLLPSRILFEISPTQKAEGTQTESKEQAGFVKFIERQARESFTPGSGFDFVTLGILFLAGLLTAFTPCVYPLYPITLGIFTRWAKKSDEISNRSGFRLVLGYCSGIVFSYASLGLVSAATGSLFGSLTQGPVFLFTVGFLILASALIFSGWIEIPLLARIQNAFSKAEGPLNEKDSGSLRKAVAMGATLGLVASPCVGPVLVALLGWLTQKLNQGGLENYLLGFLYLSIFGIGMSFPFLVLGHFLFRNRKTLSLGRWAIPAKNLGTSLMMIAAAYFFYMGWNSSSLGNQKIQKNFPVLSLDQWDRSRNSILDFRADWCVACLELEKLTFTEPRVSRLFESGEWDFVQIDLTETNATHDKIIEEFSIQGLPTVMVIRNGKVCENITLFGFEEADEFLRRLEKSKSDCVDFKSP